LGCSDSPTAPKAPDIIPVRDVIDVFPAWSPDGHTIAYFRVAPSSEGPPGIYAINSDGSGNHLLLESNALLYDLRFSPGGSALALGRLGDIYIFDIAKSELTPITNMNGDAQSPDWSPDSKSIVYMRPFGMTQIVDVQTRVERVLPVAGADPRWSPLGEPIAFWSGEGSASLDIFSVRSDGTGLRKLTSNALPNLAMYPRWVEGGERLVYTWVPSDPRRAETRIMSSDGGEQATWSTHLYSSQAISPGFEEFVLIRAQPSDSLGVLFVQGVDDPEGNSLRQLTFFTASQDSSLTREVTSRSCRISTSSRLN
jgi:Tol biopolymer transport system component